jgi:hypothetical protein
MKHAHVSKAILSVLCIVYFAAAPSAHAGDEADKVREALLEQLEINLTPLRGAALDRVLGKTAWELEATLIPATEYGQAARSNRADKVYYVDGRVKRILIPSTNMSVDYMLDLIDPDFTLTEETASLLQETLKALMHDRFFDEIDPDIVRQDDSTWIFYTGTFFRNLKGFVVTVNEEGQVQAVDYSLRLEDNR